METKIIICDCGLADHQLLIHIDKEYKEVEIKPHLITHNNLIKRIIVAVKYIFGYKSRYGAWDSLIITKSNYQPLKDIVNNIESDYETN